MKKSYRFNEKSDKQCADCGTKLKKNLLDRKPNAIRCYLCYTIREEEVKGHKHKNYIKNKIKREERKFINNELQLSQLR